MKIKEVFNIIQGNNSGFRVSFERVEGTILRSDYFPDKEEKPIKNEEIAWDLAEEFADATFGECINIRVIDSTTYIPVEGYKKRMIKNR